MRPFSKTIDRLIHKRKVDKSDSQTATTPVTRSEIERVFAYDLRKATSTLSKYKMYGMLPKLHANRSAHMEPGE